jgi:hypothetical protein
MSGVSAVWGMRSEATARLARTHPPTCPPAPTPHKLVTPTRPPTRPYPTFVNARLQRTGSRERNV